MHWYASGAHRVCIGCASGDRGGGSSSRVPSMATCVPSMATCSCGNAERWVRSAPSDMNESTRSMKMRAVPFCWGRVYLTAILRSLVVLIGASCGWESRGWEQGGRRAEGRGVRGRGADRGGEREIGSKEVVGEQGERGRDAVRRGGCQWRQDGNPHLGASRRQKVSRDLETLHASP